VAQPWARAFYNSAIWKQQRLHALRRDQYSCVDCGGRAEEVHHRIELTVTNITDPSVSLALDNLVSLCYDCHQKRHKGVTDVAVGYRFDERGQMVPDR